MLRITRYCHIRNKKIFSNGILFFQPEQDVNLTDFLDRAYDFLKCGYPKFYKMDTLSKLAFIAAEVLLANKALEPYSSEQISLVLSNASSSLDTDLRYLETTKTAASPSLFVYTLPNIAAGEICIRHKIKGENAFFISEKFDPDLMSSYIEMVFLNALPIAIGSPMPPDSYREACLAGWIETLEEHHDVFLYLTEKNTEAGLEHSARTLKELYHQ